MSTVIGGISYSARGEITLSPSGISVDHGTNQNGTVYRTVTPKAITAELTFDSFVDVNGVPLKWSDNLMEMTNLAATFVARDTGKTYLLTGAFFTGDPQVNLANGEVSGLGIAAEHYEEV